MYNTNIFEQIKEYLNPQQVSEYYMPEKGKQHGGNLFYKSPFRVEKTASFCVSNTKGFHDFGTGWHGDIINFVSELYKIKPIDAVKILIRDFSLPIKMNKNVDFKEVKKFKQKNIANKKVTESLNNWYNSTFIKLCDANKMNEISIGSICKELKNPLDFENENILIALQYLYNQQIGLELWIEEFINVKTEEQKLKLFRQRREVEKYVDR